MPFLLTHHWFIITSHRCPVSGHFLLFTLFNRGVLRVTLIRFLLFTLFNQVAALRRLLAAADNGATAVGRVGETWIGPVDASWGPGDVLPDAGGLVGALAVTAACDTGEEEGRRRIAATAWEDAAGLAAYMERVAVATATVMNFGQLVDWGAGALGDLECPCCDPKLTEGMGLASAGSLNGAANGAVGPRRTAGGRLTAATGPRIDATERPSSRLAAPFVPAKDPAWLREREEIYAAVRARREEERAAQPAVPIEVTLPDGTVMGAEHNLTSWRSTPLDVARAISDGLANVAVVARVRHTRRVGQAERVVEGLDHGKGEEEEEEDGGAGDGEERAELWDLTRECPSGSCLGVRGERVCRRKPTPRTTERSRARRDLAPNPEISCPAEVVGQGA